MKKPLVSVIIPTYNRIEYLLQAIESVLSQSYDQLEIIVVNDGSIGDDYLNHKYSDKVKQINLKVNQKSIHGYGPGSIRNFGIESSHGEWIAFLDDDDVWLDNKIEKQISSLLISGDEFCSTDALIGNGRYDKKSSYPSFLNKFYYEKNKKLLYRNYFISRLKKLEYPEKFTKEFLTTLNPIITSSVVIKKSLLVKLGGFRNLPYAADYDLWRAALQFTDCLFLNETLVYYDNSHGFGREYSK